MPAQGVPARPADDVPDDQNAKDGAGAADPAILRAGLSGIFDRPHLPDDRDLDLAGIIELVLDLRGDVLGDQRGPVVGDLAGVDHDPDLAAGLEGEGLGHAVEALGQRLELFQPLDVVFEKLPPGARPGGRQRVGRLDEDGLDRREIDVAVVGGDGRDHGLVLAVLPAELDAQLGVRPLDLPVDGLADVVQEPGPQGRPGCSSPAPGPWPR